MPKRSNNRLTSIKMGLTRAMYDPKWAWNQAARKIAENERPIKKWLIRIAIIGVILLLLGFLFDLFFSMVTVYQNGKPVFGAGVAK